MECGETFLYPAYGRSDSTASIVCFQTNSFIISIIISLDLLYHKARVCGSQTPPECFFVRLLSRKLLMNEAVVSWPECVCVWVCLNVRKWCQLLSPRGQHPSSTSSSKDVSCILYLAVSVCTAVLSTPCVTSWVLLSIISSVKVIVLPYRTISLKCSTYQRIFLLNSWLYKRTREMS